MKQLRILNATQIKLLACFLMLTDHIGMLFFPQHLFLRIIGRLAFPLFAFQIAEGYRYTRSFLRYAGRLLLFALFSEIPFDLLLTGRWYSFSYQNVLFTLFIGLLICRLHDIITFSPLRQNKIFSAVGIVLLLWIAALLHTDYGAIGALTVWMFFYTQHTDRPMFYRTVGMAILHIFLQSGGSILILGISIPIQSFALCALPLIAAYNEKKGTQNRMVQYGCYIFYPLHLLILGILK